MYQKRKERNETPPTFEQWGGIGFSQLASFPFAEQARSTRLHSLKSQKRQTQECYDWISAEKIISFRIKTLIFQT